MELIETGRSKHLYYSFPEHRHGYWEVLLNEQGEGTMYIENNTYDFHPGSIALIPPYISHKKESKEGFRDRSLFFKNFRYIGGKGPKIFEDDQHKTVKEIFDMADRFHSKDPLVKDEIESAILNVLGDLLYHVLASFYDRSKKKDVRLESVIECMHENISNIEFDLTKAIEASGYSMGYFRKIFKEMTGMPPAKYFNQLRITNAKSLFQQFGDSRTIKEVAFSSGFADALYFSRLFRKSEGKSPQQYILEVKNGITQDDIKMVELDTPKEWI